VIEYYSILIFLIIIKGGEQRKAFLLFAILFTAKVFLTDIIKVNFSDDKTTRFFLNNTVRIIQHLIMTISFFYFIYKDKRSIPPILINTMIVVLYFVSNILILFDEWYVQIIIYNYKTLFGCLVIISMVDLGHGFYERIFSSLSLDRIKFGILRSPDSYVQNKEIVREGNK